MTELILSTTSLILDPIAAVVFLILLLYDGFFKDASVLLRVAVAVFSAGLLGQSVRSYIAFTTGEFPSEFILPWWIFKDWGLVLLALHYAIDRVFGRGASCQ